MAERGQAGRVPQRRVAAFRGLQVYPVRVPDDFEEEPSDETKSEGVRILGAEEAQAAVEASSGRASEEPPRPRREPPPDAKPAARFPLPTDRPERVRRARASSHPGPPPARLPLRAHRRYRRAALDGRGQRPGPAPALDRPPTGEVPMIPSDEADDIFATSGSTPRFRGEGDWSETDFADFDDEPVHDEDSGELGALGRRSRHRRRRALRRRSRRPSPDRPGAARPRGQPPRTAGAYGAPSPTDRPARPSIARDDLTTRIITGVVLAVVGLSAFALGRAVTAGLITLIVAASPPLELYEGFRRAGFQPATLIGLLGCRGAGGHRVQLRRARVPAGLRGGRSCSRCSGILCKVVARAPDGERRGHHARLSRMWACSAVSPGCCSCTPTASG